MAGIFLGISAAGWAAISTTVAVAGSAASFGQANKQKNAMRQADAEAERKMRAAREKLEVNYLDTLSIPMEAYEREREALLVSGATAMQAATEGEERGVTATAGRVLQAQQAGQAASRTAMAQDIFNLDAAVAQEDSRLRDVGVGLDLQEAEGAQQASADAAAARANAISQGTQQAVSAVQQTISAAPLYGKSATTKQLTKMMETNPDLQSQVAAKYRTATFGSGEDAITRNVADLAPKEFRDWMGTNFSVNDLQSSGFLTVPPTPPTPTPPSVPYNSPYNFQRQRSSGGVGGYGNIFNPIY